MRKIILALIGLLIFHQISQAVRPLEFYKKGIEESKIKAVAKVTKIKISKWTNSVQNKEVTFELIKSFSENTPKEFYGKCKSVKKRFPFDSPPPVGGDLYHYPKVGQTVFVSVYSNGSIITSYIPINKKTKQKLFKSELKDLNINPFTIEFED